MATLYVYSGAGGAGTGADWTDAFTTLAAAFTAGTAGDTFYVAHDHAETQASAMTITTKGTAAAPYYAICVNRAGSVPPVAADLATTATVTTTGANAMTLTSSAASSTYIYGITFACGTGATNVALTITGATGTAGVYWRFVNCALKKLGTTGVSLAIIIGTTQQGSLCAVVLDNTTAEFGATSDGIGVRSATLFWRNTTSAIVGATLPATLIRSGGSTSGKVRLRNLDLSALSGTIIGNAEDSPVQSMENVRLHASATIATSSNNPTSMGVATSRVDSAGTNYRHELYAGMGSQVVETTIVRTGGASDGTTPIAWKLVSTSNAKRAQPLQSLPIAVWNDSTAARTLTVYGIWGGGAVPTNDDIWAEVEYLGSASHPLGSVVSSGVANLIDTATNNTADSSTWGGSTTAFKIDLAFTAGQKGYVTVRLYVGAASTTVYIDPKVSIA